MSLGLGWKLHGDGNLSGPDDVVAPDERLGWGKTVGLGAQHVVAMFGATFVFPLIMGLNPQLAIMMSGIATIAFLLIVQGKVPSYLGTSASFVGGVAAIRAQGGDSKEVTGAILVAGLVLAARRRAHPRARLRRAAQGAAAGRHRRGRHADRVQPRPGRRQHLLAAGPVGGLLRDGLHHRLRRGLPGLHLAHRDLPGADLRHRPVVGARQDRRRDHLGAARAPPRRPATSARTSRASRTRRSSASRPQTTSRRRQGGRGLAHAELLDGGHPARAAGRDRPHRREHRPRQGGRRDDRPRPRPRDGPGHRRRRRRHRPRLGGRRLPHDHLRREHRRHGGDPRLLDRGLLRGRGRGDHLRPLTQVRRARRLRPRAVCSAGSPWCSTA